MKFCSNCGNAVADNSRFCPSCGAQSSATVTTPSAGGRHLRCPSCKSSMITPIVESSNTGGVAVGSRVTGGIGVAGYTFRTMHRNYWMCQTCGNKFRNIQNLADEIKMEGNKKIACLIIGSIFSLVAIFLGIMLANKPRMAILLVFPLVMMAVVSVVTLGIGFVSMVKVKKMTAEKEYLEANCFH